MATKWTDAANSEGGTSSKMAEGYHRAKVTKAMRHKKDGSEFRSAKGAFLMLVLENADGDEASTNLFLTEKAAWKFAKTLSRLGFDLERMEQNNVDISHFEDEAFAAKQLIGRECWISVKPTGENDKYTDVEFYHEAELPIHVLQQVKQAAQPVGVSTGTQPVTEDDIPF